MTNCMPPTSSKKRSNTIVSCVGRQPSATWPAARYSRSCSAAGSAIPTSSTSQRRMPSAAAQARGDLGAQARHRGRQFVAATGRLAEPERNGRRPPVRILDPHHATFDAHDAIALVAELEDIAGHALDREILVHGADEMVL